MRTVITTSAKDAAGPTGVWTAFGYVMSGPFTSDSVSVQSDSITSTFLINPALYLLRVLWGDFIEIIIKNN